MYSETMKITDTGRHWKIWVRCGYCGKIHSHNGGRNTEEITLGKRLAHCKKGSYELHKDICKRKIVNLLDGKILTFV